MQDRDELLRIARDLKRGMRHPGVLAICDAVEELLRKPVAKEQQAIKYAAGPTQVLKRVGRPPIGKVPMTPTERTKRWREKRRKEGK